jgi:pilus assembly protein CpaE
MAPKILIADDDPETLRLVSLMLQRQGYQVVTANNGVQAIGLARVEKPDLMIVDVMMPDLDGFEVVRQLRKNAETATTPILMFTAKSQVEDKVQGYEAGADDYLTKPVHPAELQARLKSLLARAQSRSVAAAPAVQRGYVIGVMAAKGGVGCSSLTLNLALSFSKRAKTDVIAAEIEPSQGSWALELGFNNAEGLCDLLRHQTNEINQAMVEKYLMKTTFGPRLLLSSNKLKDIELTATSGTQLTAVIQTLPYLAPYIFLDIGSGDILGIDNILASCNEMLVVTDPLPSAVQRTRLLINELAEKGFGKSKLLNVIILNRVRSDIQLSASQIQEALGVNISIVIPPAPEQAYQAALRFVPLIMVQQEGLLTQQFLRLADEMAQRLRNK